MPNCRFLSSLLTALCLAAFGLSVSGSGSNAALAQDTLQIAAIVNDEVISGYDVEQRIQLIIVSAGLQDTPETRRRLRNQVLRSLVDERLQMQEAHRFNIEVADQELNRAFDQIAAQNKMDRDSFDRLLDSRSVPKRAMEAQIKAEIAWTKLVRRRFGNSVQIGDDEVDEILDRLKSNAGKTQHRISEIFLPFDTAAQAAEVTATAQRLYQQLKDGASFAAMARQFSGGATAAQGGQVGWIQPGQLGQELDAAIDRLSTGEISEPIRTRSGIYIIQVEEQRQIMGTDPKQTKLALKQLLFRLPDNPDEEDRKAQREFASSVSGAVQGCDDIEAVGKEIGENIYADLGELQLGDLPPKIRDAVKDVGVGQFAKPLETDAGVMLLMVCKREEPALDLPNRDRIADDLSRQRIGAMAQRYMRDLRRSAVVELR